MGIKEERQKKRAQQRRMRRLWMLVAIVLVVLVGRGTWDVFKKNQRATGSRADQLAQLRSLQSRRDELTAEVARIESPRGLEEELRTSFPVAALGEGVVVVSEEPIDENVVTIPVPAKSTWWSRIKGLFLR